jgi:hypothetical protein
MTRKACVFSAALVGAVATMFACSSSTSSGSGPSPWAGNFACTGTESGTLTAPTATTVNQPVDFDGTGVVSGNTLTATAEPGDSGGAPCVLTGTINGDTVTLNGSTQMCTQVTALGTVNVTYTSGTLTLSGTSFTATFAITVSGPATGAGTLTLSCTQM